MYIVKSKRLEKKVNEVEVLGVKSTFYGNTAGIVSNENGKEFNVVILNDLEKIGAENYLLPSMVSCRQEANELYQTLK